MILCWLPAKLASHETARKSVAVTHCVVKARHRIRSLISFLLVLSAIPSDFGEASTPIRSCRDCLIGARERARWASYLRNYDVVFEGTYLGADTVRAGEDSGQRIIRFRIDKFLRGI